MTEQHRISFTNFCDCDKEGLTWMEPKKAAVGSAC